MKAIEIITYDSFLTEALVRVAESMLLAAKTAPKARGIDNIKGIYVTGSTIKKIAEKMIIMGEKDEQAFFVRDAFNIVQAPVLVLLGTAIKPINLKKCGLCGFGNCEGKINHKDAPCAFNTGDLGIAIGSAVSIAMDNRIDNRVMFSVGMAARELNILGNDIKITYGIPLSANSKNIFFDRG